MNRHIKHLVAFSMIAIGVTTFASAEIKSSLDIGSRGSEVKELQDFLKTKGYFNNKSSGTYDDATKNAVAEYQSEHGIHPVGRVGQLTRKHFEDIKHCSDSNFAKGASASVRQDCDKNQGNNRKDKNRVLVLSLFGKGSVASAPVGSNCWKNCVQKFADNSLVTLTATPTKGYSFKNWGGACSKSTSTTCDLTMNSSKHAWATFTAAAPLPTAYIIAQPPYLPWYGSYDTRVNWGSNNATSCLTSTGQTGLHGGFLVKDLATTTTFSVTCINGANTVTANVTVKVTPPATAVNGVCGPSNGATLTSAPTTGLCSKGTATAVTGSGPWAWQCNGSNGGTTASCSASLLLASNVLTTTVSGSGNVVSSPAGINCPGTCMFSYATGTVVTLTATQGSGSTFTNWTGACSGSTPTCTVSMSQARTVGAVFTAIPAPTATISANPTTVDYSGTSTISWSSTNATSCNLSSGQSGTSGSFAAGGLTAATTFTVTCIGLNGSASSSVLVSVNAPTETTATVSSVLADCVTWTENLDATTTCEGGVSFSGTPAFLSSGILPAAGDVITFIAPSKRLSVMMTPEQAAQIEQLFGGTYYVGGSKPAERYSGFGLALKELVRDFSSVWAYDIRAGIFTANSGGKCYFSDTFGFCFAAEDIVNSVMVGAKTSTAVPVYITPSVQGDWYSTAPLTP